MWSPSPCADRRRGGASQGRSARAIGQDEAAAAVDGMAVFTQQMVDQIFS